MDNIVNFTINLNGTAYTGVAQLDEALGNVLVDVQKTQSWFGNLKDAIGASSIKLDAFIGVVEKVSQAFQSLVGSSLDFEQQQANIRTLLNGDTEATDNLIGKIREYGKATVYDRSGLIEAQKTMMAFGLDAEYAFGKLKNIGDIALGDKQKMQSLALAFSQTSSTGKLMGQDLLQMINAGFNPLEVISQKTGKSIAELKEEMGKGAISAEMVAQAFEWATEEGGRFYQGAETAAQTTAGKIAKVKDQIDDLKISIFEWSHGLTAWVAELGNMVVPISQAIPLFQVLGKSVINTVKWCGTNWSGFVNLVKSGVVSIGLNMGILKFSIVSAGGFFPWLRGVATAACRGISAAIMSIPVVGWIIAIGTAVIGTVALLWSKCEGFRRVVFGTWEAVKAAVGNAWQYVKTAVQIVWTVLKHVFQWYLNIIKTVLAAVRNAVDRIVETVTTLWEHIREIFTRIGDFIHSVWNRVCESFGIAINWIADKLGRIAGWVKTKMVDPIRNAFTGMWNVIRDVFDKILTKLGKLFAPIRELWNKLFPKDKMKDVKLAYAEGADKGTKSWEKSKSKGDVDTGKETIVLDGKDGLDGLAGVNGKSGKDGKAKKELSDGTLGKNAGTVAGKAQQITIKLESMVGTMNFNGGLRDNASNVESTLAEMMARILGMAETAV